MATFDAFSPVQKQINHFRGRVAAMQGAIVNLCDKPLDDKSAIIRLEGLCNFMVIYRERLNYWLAQDVTNVTPKSPEHYLDQRFSFVSGITFNVIVQSYDAEHDRFLLYDAEHPGSFYRKAEFIYEHCKPASEPVVRKVFPKMKIDKFRFLNLLSITDPEHPLYSKLKGSES